MALIKVNNRGQSADFTAERKNFVINGNGYINQRYGINPGVASSSNSTINSYAMDRWRTYGGPGTFFLSSRVDAGAGEGDQTYIRFQRQNGDTNTNQMGIAQGIETIMSKQLAGKTVTLSFRARAGSGFTPTNNGLTSQVYGGTGTNENPVGMTGMSSLGVITHQLTTSWQTFSTAIAIPSDRTQCTVAFSHVPTGTAGGSDYYDIREIQLEIGSVATPYEYKPISQEQNDCYRYYYGQVNWEDGQYATQGSGVVGMKAWTQASSGHQNTWVVTYPVAMRKVPTVTPRANTAGATANAALKDVGGTIGVSFTGSNRCGCSMFSSNDTTYGNAYTYIEADAEL